MSNEPLFDAVPPEPIELTCSHCSTTASLPEAGARSSGWRIIHTTSQSGAPYHDVLCGSCSGRGDRVPVPSWDWRCVNCGTQFSDLAARPPGRVPLISVDEAWRSASHHKCEPHFEFLPPGINNWIPDWDPIIISSLSAD